MDQLAINEKIGPNYMLLELSGIINGYTMSEFTEKTYRFIIDTNVVLDLNLVSGIDSAAMGVIMAAHNDGEKNGTKLFLMNPSEKARHALDKTGFTDTFNIIHSVTEVSDA